ncbi:hypothetical protein ACET3Z_016707 [Daucus carota]
MSARFIPDQILTEILIRLPVESLLRFRYKTLPVHNLPPLISSTDVKWASLSFGFVHSMNDYRVVRIVNYYATNRTDRSFVVCVYSLNTNSWKTKTIRDDFLVEILQPRSNTVNGVSFWLVNKENVKTLLSYDTNNDVLRNTALPDHQMGAVFSMHQYGQSLAYFAGVNSNVINMWILKDSKNKYFWEKKFSVNLDKDIGTGVLGIRNNGELILSRLTDLVSYDAEQKKVNDFVESWNCWPCNAKHMVLAPGFPSCWCTNAVNNAGYLGTPPFVAEQFVGSLVLLDVEWKNSSRL